MIEDITLHEGELTNIPLSIKRQRFYQEYVLIITPLHIIFQFFEDPCHFQ